MAYSENNATGRLLEIASTGEGKRLSYPDQFGEWGHRFSPDGRWLAYASDRDGAQDLWVRPVPELDPEFKISTAGGVEPIWSRDGSRIVFRRGGAWFTTDVSTEPSFSASPPRELFETAFVDTFGISWDLGPDGRVLLLKPVEEPDPTRLRIVLNWFSELESLVPTD